MKNLLMVAVVVLATVSMSSCKKDYTCTCEFGGVESSVTYEKVKKADAQESCDALDAVSGYSCTLD